MSRCSVTHEETVLAKLPQNHVQGPVPSGNVKFAVSIKTVCSFKI